MIPVLCYVSIQIFFEGKNNSWQGQIVGNQVAVRENGVMVDFTKSLDKLGYELRQPKAFVLNDNDCLYLEKYEKFQLPTPPTTIGDAIVNKMVEVVGFTQ